MRNIANALKKTKTRNTVKQPMRVPPDSRLATLSDFRSNLKNLSALHPDRPRT